jgi:uncharacterized RmlC-like cupin family protein
VCVCVCVCVCCAQAKMARDCSRLMLLLFCFSNHKSGAQKVEMQFVTVAGEKNTLAQKAAPAPTENAVYLLLTRSVQWTGFVLAYSILAVT